MTTALRALATEVRDERAQAHHALSHAARLLERGDVAGAAKQVRAAIAGLDWLLDAITVAELGRPDTPKD